MTHRQALQGFPDTNHVSVHKTVTLLTFIVTVPAWNQEVPLAFNFISERTLCVAYTGRGIQNASARKENMWKLRVGTPVGIEYLRSYANMHRLNSREGRM